MKQDIKNKEPQERQAYVPASMGVIEVAPRQCLAASPNILPETYPYEEQTW